MSENAFNAEATAIKYGDLNIADQFTYGKLTDYNTFPSRAAAEIHQELDSIVSNKDNSTASPLPPIPKGEKKGLTPGKCYRCGAPTEERTGKFGTFYGCTMYPNCRGSWKP